jgi:glyoxylase-like metal-dependent hydrolase (beta-lactamase superfamily II)
MFMKTRTTAKGLKIIHVNGLFFNSYLIFNGEKYILVDSGRKYFWKRLKRNLEVLGVNRNNLSALILTHTHFDHAENAANIKEQFGTKIIAHESEAGYLEAGDSPLPAGTVFYTKWLMKTFRTKAQPMFRYRPVTCDVPVGDKFDLTPLGFNAYVLHVRGHTKGSIAIIVDNEIAFTGDNMVGVSRRSIFPPFGDDIPGIIRSWKTLLDTGCSLFIPNHGTPKKREILERHYERKIKDMSRTQNR